MLTNQISILLEILDNSQKSKYLKKLKNSSFRKKESKALVEGFNLISEAAKLNIVSNIFFSTVNKNYLNLFETFKNKINFIKISEKLANQLADSVNTQGIFAEINTNFFKENDLTGSLKSLDKILFLENISDPGNAGTMIRLGAAFGFDSIFFSNKSVDIFNAKLQRSTAGSLFQIPITKISNDEFFLNLLVENNYDIYVTDLNGDVNLSDINQKFQNKFVWIFGNESNGVSTFSKSLATKKVRIEMSGETESLNVASAGAICMYYSSIIGAK